MHKLVGLRSCDDVRFDAGSRSNHRRMPPALLLLRSGSWRSITVGYRLGAVVTDG